MEVQYEDGMLNEMDRGIHGRIVPFVEEVFIEECSDDSCGDQDRLSTDAVGMSENGDTDYDLEDEEEFDEEDEEEEEDDEDGDDESQIHAMIDDLETKFRTLVATKIEEAEQFFDNAVTFQRLLSQSTLIEAQNGASAGLSQCSQQEETDEPHCSKEKGNKSGKSASNNPPLECNTVSTQTDGDPLSHSLSSHFLVRETDDEEVPKDPPEKARHEIGKLRDVRDSLISQRQQWAAELKKGESKSEEDFKVAECKVFEIEEAIEAVDTAIEFKNEVVLGQKPNKPLISDATPGSNEAELVTRLETLSVQELRRLLCVFFSKVVELRSSSRKLEKHLEYTEASNDRLRLKLAQENKRVSNIKDEYDNRIRMVLCSKNDNGVEYTWFKRMDDQLNAAQKKQHDLQRSLTELLVRHGYLVNGADYDVKQVVKMLGIESQFTGGATSRHHGGGGGGAAAHAGNQPAGPVSRAGPHHSRSGWQKEPKSSSHLGHRRNGRQLDGHELSRLHRDNRLTDHHGWEREHRHAIPQTSSHPAEVRREKGKIIIQPSSGGGHSSSRGHNGGHNSHHHSHQRPHDGYGSHHHGYK